MPTAYKSVVLSLTSSESVSLPECVALRLAAGFLSSAEERHTACTTFTSPTNDKHIDAVVMLDIETFQEVEKVTMQCLCDKNAVFSLVTQRGPTSPLLSVAFCSARYTTRRKHGE